MIRLVWSMAQASSISRKRIAAIAERTRVFGNGAETLKRAKDPLALTQVCEANGVRHPQIAFAPPDEPELWLIKRRGGAGGAHIAMAEAASLASPDCYFQRRVGGESISALFLASERKPEIIGLSMQWTAPTPASPFRYGGAAGPVDIDPAQAEEIARSVATIASELDLVGLNSADFLVSTDAVWLIEINPRPGATLDVFESNETPLFARHIAACEGRLACRLLRASHSRRLKSSTPLTMLSCAGEGIGRIGRSTDRRLGHSSQLVIPCARCLALARPSIWREPAPASGRGKSSLSFRRRTIERGGDHKRQSTRRRTDGCAATRRRDSQISVLPAGRAEKL